MTGYTQDPKQMQAAYTSQQSMMSGMIPQQGYGSIPQSQHQQQSQQRLSQHYPQSGHQMYPTPPQQAPAPVYGGYGVQHQSSRSATAQHPSYSHSQLDQTNYGHLPNQGVGLPPIPIQQAQQPHLSQTTAGHQQQQHQLHQHPSMNPSAQPPVLGSSHGAQQQQPQNQSHLTSQNPAMHHTSSVSQHQSTMGAQSTNQASHQIPQGHPAQMSHQLGHGMLASYGSQMTGTPAAAPPQAPTYLPNSKQAPATQQAQHGNSPQYRAPFPQLSPQMSPRPPQMSPHPQMSPRPVMSPAKPPTQQQQQQTNLNQASSISPHPHMPGISSPSARSQSSLPPIQTNVKSSITPTSVSNVPNTLQALEQMVMPTNASAPGMDYSQSSYRQQALPSMPNNNPLSPLGSRVTMSPQHQQHQQWPTHRSQMNGNSHHNIMSAQMQMQQMQSSAGQMMVGQLPDLMASTQAIQVIPPSSSQLQQPSYNSYDDMTQVQQQQPQQKTLDSIHKPYENLTPSVVVPSLQLASNTVNQLMSPTLQNQQIDQRDQYGSMQTNQASLSTLESTDQSSDLNLLDSYSNSATVNTSNMSSTAQKSSIEDSLLSQTTNENSQSSQVSDTTTAGLMQTNCFSSEMTQDDNANQQSVDQDQTPCLESSNVDFSKQTELETDQQSQASQENPETLDKADEYDFDEPSLKPKLADSTVLAEKNDALITSEMTNVDSEVTTNVSFQFDFDIFNHLTFIHQF